MDQREIDLIMSFGEDFRAMFWWVFDRLHPFLRTSVAIPPNSLEDFYQDVCVRVCKYPPKLDMACKATTYMHNAVSWEAMIYCQVSRKKRHHFRCVQLKENHFEDSCFCYVDDYERISDTQALMNIMRTLLDEPHVDVRKLLYSGNILELTKLGRLNRFLLRFIYDSTKLDELLGVSRQALTQQKDLMIKRLRSNINFTKLLEYHMEYYK